MPFDTIKIDRSFIRDVLEVPENNAICRVVIALAHNLNKMVVAEGVETEEQAQFLRELNCDFMQGYLFSQPLPSEELMVFVRQQQ